MSSQQYHCSVTTKLLLPESESQYAPRKTVPAVQHKFQLTCTKRVYHFVEHIKRKDGEVRRQISVHAMRDFVRQRKYQQNRQSSPPKRLEWVKKAQLEPQMSSHVVRSPRFRSTTPSDSRGGVVSRRPLSTLDKRESVSRQEENTHLNASRRRQRNKKCKSLPAETLSPSLVARFMNPNTFCGNATDPFQTLPDHCTGEEQNLLKNCKRPRFSPTNLMSPFS